MHHGRNYGNAQALCLLTLKSSPGFVQSRAALEHHLYQVPLCALSLRPDRDTERTVYPSGLIRETHAKGYF